MCVRVVCDKGVCVCVCVIELCVKELRGKALYVKELCERVV